MKKVTLALMALLAFSFTLKAQQYVSTTPTTRNVILEEFTGRTCGYCPDGHVVANNIAAAHPGHFWAINIHSEGYFSPTSYPNLNTVKGNQIRAAFNCTSFPGGVVNRSTASSIGRGSWASYANTEFSQTAECNVGGVVNINPQTRVATMTIEVYYTANSTQSTNYLTVAMLQDSILGSQSGMSSNPGQIVNGQYCHMHVLRDIITETMGEAISPTTSGSLITRTYTYNIPETIGSPNGVTVDLSNIHFLAWVTEQYQGTPTRPILNACELDNPNAPCYITTSSNPTNGGTTSGGGAYTNGQTCTLTATPAAGCSFINWTKNGTVVSTNATYSFTVTGSGNYVANFNVPSYTITTSSNPTNGGTTSGGGSFTYGQSCTIHANAASGYTFINWTKNGTQVSTNANYTFTVTESATYVANFEAQTFTITVEATPEEGGTVTGGGTYNMGQNCTLTATPNDGYTFVKWTRNGSQVSTNATYTFVVTQNATYIAHFQPRDFYIAISSNPSNAGTVSGGGTYSFGETCTVHAMPNTGFGFVEWTEGGNQVSTEADYSFTVSGGRNLVAQFGRVYEIVVEADPEAGATVSGSGTYFEGETVTVTAEPNENYTFVNWTEGEQVASEELVYTFTATKDCTLVAHLIYYDGVGEQAGGIAMYPNPVKGMLTVEASVPVSSIEIYSLTGALVLSKKGCANKTEIDMDGMPSGIYFIRMVTENTTETMRFVKE